jgi:hypothetical protein
MVGAFLLALVLVGVLYFLQQSNEGFSMQEDLTKMVKSVGKIGKKLLDPDMWNYRIQIMNLSPVELARKQIALDNAS